MGLIEICLMGCDPELLSGWSVLAGIRSTQVFLIPNTSASAVLPSSVRPWAGLGASGKGWWLQKRLGLISSEMP